MREPFDIIYAVPFDLDTRDGNVTFAVGTMEACREAEKIAYTVKNPLFLTTATRPRDKRYRSVKMGELMRRFFITLGFGETVFHEAKEFNTFAEVVAIAQFLQELEWQGTRANSLTIAIKCWHRPRFQMLVEGIFPIYGIELVPEYVEHDIPGRPATVGDIRHERLGTYKDKFFLWLLEYTHLPRWAAPP